ncbi:transposase [Nephila pilipes]|uniref:Transposase n=1 Tax=Nephila pilipes TaxID=299642 RepID=A0A8X6TJ80_NEPPI|nr:transposase [Nephila pilipes]
MIGKEHAKLIDCVPLSDTTISRRVKIMSNFCENELIKRLKAFKHGFAIQLDEATEIAGLSIFLVIVSCINGTTVKEVCKSLLTGTTAELIFSIIYSYFKKYDIFWICIIKYVPTEQRQCLETE